LQAGIEGNIGGGEPLRASHIDLYNGWRLEILYLSLSAFAKQIGQTFSPRLFINPAYPSHSAAESNPVGPVKPCPVLQLA
jgi:hypothetical protein